MDSSVPHFRFGFWALVAAIPLYAAVRLCGASVSVGQVFIFPVLLLGLSFLVVQGRWRVPLWCLCLALVGAILSGRSFVAGGFSGAPVVATVSRLNSDDLGTVSRILREEIIATVGRYSDGLVGVYHHPVLTNKEALSFVSDGVGGDMLVRGDSKWITVVSGGPWSESLQTIAPRSLAVQGIPLSMVTRLPAFGLSFRPREDTATFLGLLFSGMLATKNEPFGTVAHAEGTTSLLAAALRESPWSSFSHRGYAWFLLGNEYVREALSSEIYQPAEMECAFDAYSRARNVGKTRDNPDLIAATLNNTAVALFVHERHSGLRRRAKVTSRSLLKDARALRTMKSPFGLSLVAPKIAAENSEILQTLGNSRGVSPRNKRGSLGQSGRKKHKKRRRLL